MAVGAATVLLGLGWLTRIDPPVPARFGADPAGSSAAVPTASPMGDRGAPPTRLRLSTADAPVDPVAVDARGRLAVPPDSRRAGWWIGGAAPGATSGTVVIAGHVDDAAMGPGPMSALHRLGPGDRVLVETGRGTVPYEVTARRAYAKADLPADLFTIGGPSRLALVTCGGTFHDGQYSHNVVVYAKPRPRR
jgi:hypothetical protein